MCIHSLLKISQNIVSNPTIYIVHVSLARQGHASDHHNKNVRHHQPYVVAYLDMMIQTYKVPSIKIWDRISIRPISYLTKAINPSNFTLFKSLFSSEHVDKTQISCDQPVVRYYQNEKMPLRVKNQNGCGHGKSVRLTRWRFIGCFLILYARKLQNKHMAWKMLVLVQNRPYHR